MAGSSPTSKAAVNLQAFPPLNFRILGIPPVHCVILGFMNEDNHSMKNVSFVSFNSFDEIFTEKNIANFERCIWPLDIQLIWFPP